MDKELNTNKIALNLLYITAFILGSSLFVSTALMSFSYFILALLAFLQKDALAKLKSSFSVKIILSYNIFYGCFIIGCLWASVPHSDSLVRLYRIIFFAIAPLLYSSLSVINCPKWLLRGFIAGAILSVSLSILAFIFKHPILQGVIEATYGGSPWVIFHGHILHNSFLAIAAIMILNLIIDKNIHKTKLVIVLYSLLYALICIDIFYMVDGRTGWAIFTIMHLVLLVMRFKLKGIVFGLILVAISSMLLYKNFHNVQNGVNAYIYNEHQYTLGNYQTSMGLREEFHSNSVAIIKAKPWFGYGTGSFKSVYAIYAKSHNNRFATLNPHGDWYSIGVELGILGIGVFILMLGTNLYSFYRLNNIFYKVLGLSLLGAYIGASFENSFFIDNVSGVTYIVLALTIIAADKQGSFLLKQPIKIV